MIGQRLSMRLYTDRATQSTDDWGNKGVATWNSNLSGEPCYVYVKGGGEQWADRMVSNQYDLTMIVGRKADIIEYDRVSKIEDKIGNQKYGLMKIVGIISRKGHKEVSLKRWSGDNA